MKYPHRLVATICILWTYMAMNAPGKEPTVNTNGSPAASLPIEGQMPSLGQAASWLNSPRLNAAELRGKVVLVDFWTYTCINWRRTLPHLRTWAERYRDRGLVVIGVHTPEFSFERNIDYVQQAVKDQAIGYPVVIDNDYSIWNAFGNRYWPAVYLVDAQGRIRYHQFGESDYHRLELVIQQLLGDARREPMDGDLQPIQGAGAEAGADWRNLQSPETYLGRGRSQGFASPGVEVLSRARTYKLPDRLRLNHWGLAGSWTRGNESVRLNDAGGRLVYRFHARDVHLVMGPAAGSGPVRYRVLIDGQPPGQAHGVDVDNEGKGRMDSPRMYQLIRQSGAIVDRSFEIEFLDSGAEVFVLTFG